MKKNKFFLSGLLALGLVVGMLTVACETEDEAQDVYVTNWSDATTEAAPVSVQVRSGYLSNWASGSNPVKSDTNRGCSINVTVSKMVEVDSGSDLKVVYRVQGSNSYKVLSGVSLTSGVKSLGTQETSSEGGGGDGTDPTGDNTSNMKHDQYGTTVSNEDIRNKTAAILPAKMYANIQIGVVYTYSGSSAVAWGDQVYKVLGSTLVTTE